MVPMTCPNCGAAGCQPFYEIQNVPTNSCLLVEDRAAALQFPTHDIVLAICAGCGFIFNAAWDAGRTIYSDRYEETQGFSATFNRFDRGTAQHLVETYDIRDRSVLEIGCGKGDFLSLICELGGNRGVGYDPSFVPERKNQVSGIQFVPEFFDDQTKVATPDLICCKMTLEHIGEPQRFLDMVRAVAKKESCVVFFQIPNVDRILEEGAFWDVYYEHCGYFSAASIKHLFGTSGFDVLRVWTGYDNQYLMVTAIPAPAGSVPWTASSEQVAALMRASRNFADRTARSRSLWESRLRGWAANGERTVLWGSGSKAVSFLTTLGVHDEVEHAVDINPYRVGKYLPGTGQKIVSPAFLHDYQPDNVVIMNPVYRGEVMRELVRQNCQPQVLTIADLETEQI